MANILDILGARRATGPWNGRPRPGRPLRRTRRGGAARDIALVLAFFTLGALIAYGALNPDRGRIAGMAAPIENAAGDFLRPLPITAPSVTVIDGDTVRVGPDTYRLVGIDTPETGANARCAAERVLGDAATRRVRALVHGGDVELQRVPCACRPGTEGTRRCNYGRLCGSLRADGRDVGDILIAEGLARAYHCRGTSCPRRGSWCG